MQDPREIEKSYETPDPWQYQTSPDDARRKEIILRHLAKRAPFLRALDLGAGEGWITKDLPAKEIYGFELSNNAAARFPENVKRAVLPIEGKFDLITAMGVMYAHYDYELFIRLINEHASGIVLLCNIKAWEVPRLDDNLRGLVYTDTFPYREFIEHIRIYDYS